MNRDWMLGGIMSKYFDKISRNIELKNRNLETNKSMSRRAKSKSRGKKS